MIFMTEPAESAVSRVLVPEVLVPLLILCTHYSHYNWDRIFSVVSDLQRRDTLRNIWASLPHLYYLYPPDPAFFYLDSRER